MTTSTADCCAPHPFGCPGATEILALLSDHPKAIVTGSWRSYIDAIEERISLSSHFDVIITADDTEPFGKPHPHGLLLAANRLNIDPALCLYVGDQMFDIEAARTAGMKSCLMWTSHTPLHAVGLADVEVRSLHELMTHI